MTSSAPEVHMKRYTTASGTLRAWDDRWYSSSNINFEITLDLGTSVKRQLRQYETISYHGDPIDSTVWTDSPVRRWGRHKVIPPWTLWQHSGQDIDSVQIIAAADGTGKWTLAPLPKSELDALKKTRKDKKDAENRAQDQMKAQIRSEHALTKKKRAEEAKAQMAALNIATVPTKVPIVTPQPHVRSRASMSASSSRIPSSSANSSPSRLANRSSRTSLSNGNRRSSIEKAKDPLVRCSSRASSEASVP